MAIDKDFRYIIQTQLDLAPGALSKLIEKAKQEDNKIKGLSLEVGLRTSPSARQQLQREIGNIKGTAVIDLRLNRQSLANIQREIQALVSEASKIGTNIRSAVNTANNPTAGGGSRTTGSNDSPARNNGRRVGSAVRDEAEASRRDSRETLDALRVANTELTKQKTELAKLKLESEQMLKEFRGLRNIKARVLKGDYEGISAKDVEDLMPIGSSSRLRRDHGVNIASKQNTLRRVQEQKAREQAQDLQMQLNNPKISINDKKNTILPALVKQYKDLAMAMGQNLTRSISLTQRNLDGTISKISTMTKEFTKAGEVIDRGDKSLNALAKSASKNMLIYGGMYQAINLVTQGLTASIKAMADFESQFLKIQNVSTPTDAQQIKGNIFNLAKTYGVNPTKDVLPIMNSVVRQGDIVKNPDQANSLTKLIIRAARVDSGGAIDPQNIDAISKDFMSIYKQGYEKLGKNPIKSMNSYIDQIAVMSKKNVDMGQTLDSMANLMPFVSSKGMDLRFLTSVVGATQNEMGDASGTAVSTTIKQLLDNLAMPSADGQISNSDVARKIIGIKQSDTPQDMLRKLADGVNDKSLSDEKQVAIAQKLSASSGTGTRNQTPFLQVIKSLPKAIELYNDSLNSSGAAEEIAQRNADTLSGQYGKLQAALQELSITLGQAGLMDAIKSIVKGTTVLVEGVNSVIGVFQKLGNITRSVFGESFGNQINSSVAQLIEFTLAIKAAGLAYKTFLGNGNGFSLGNLFKREGTGTIAGEVVGSVIPSISGVKKVAKAEKVVVDATKVNPFGIKGELQTNKGTSIVGIIKDFLLGPQYKSEVTTGGGRTRFHFINEAGNLANRTVPGQHFIRDAEKGLISTASKSVASTAVKAGGVAKGVGSTLLDGAGILLFNKKFSGRAASSVMAGAEEGILSKVTGSFVKMLPALGRFVLLLGRLSVWGAVIGGLAFVGSKIYASIQKAKSVSATNTEAAFNKSPEARSQTLKDLATVKSTLSTMPKNFGVSQEEFNGLSEKNKIKAREMVSYNLNHAQYAEGTAGAEQQKAYREAMIRLTGKDGLTAKEGGVFGYSYLNDTGKRKDNGIINSGDDKSISDALKLMDAINSGVGVLAPEWKLANKDALDYAQILQDIEEITTKISQATKYANLGNAISSVKFLGGGENSASAIGSQLDTSQATIASVSSNYQKLINDKNSMTNSQTGSQLRVQTAENAVKALPKSDEIFKSVNEAIANAKQSGTLSSLAEQYNPTGQLANITDEQKAKYNLIKAQADKLMEQDNLTKANQGIDQITQSISQQVSELKQLAIQYTIASSGVDAFQGSLNKLGSSIASSQHNFAMAVTVPEKIAASRDIFADTAKQARIYQAQISALQNKANSIKSNSNEDFSSNALYNPNSDGLSIQQASYKQISEQIDQIQQSANGATEQLKAQIDAISDLVLQSEKYSYVWDSVNQRIELGKKLAGELRDIQTGATVDKSVTSLKSMLFGNSFDVGSANKQGAESRRDQYIQAFAETQKAIVTYGDDAEKLKSALAEINGNLGDQLKSAFLTPLKDLVNTDFSNAGDKQLQAANTMQTSINMLQSILESYAKDAGINTGETNSIGLSASEKANLDKEYYGNIPDSNAKKIELQYGYGGDENKMYAGIQDSLLNRNPAAQKLNSVLGGALSGSGGQFVKSGQKYGIDPYLIAAISMHETGNGTNTGVKEKNNVGGIMTGETKVNSKGEIVGIQRTFASVGDSIDYMAKLLKDGYLGAGLTSISQISSKYAPVNATNDPNHLNENWTDGVSKFYQAVTGVSGKKLEFNSNGTVPTVKSDAEASVAKNNEAEKQANNYLVKFKAGAIQEQTNSLTSNGILSQYYKDIAKAKTDSSISGMSIDRVTGEYDANKTALASIAPNRSETLSTIASFNKAIGDKNTPKELIPIYKDMVVKLKNNVKSLDELKKTFEKGQSFDPRLNGKSAQSQINGQLDKLNSLKANGQAGGVEWYQTVGNINQMSESFMSRKKQTESQQQLFDNHGQQYDRLITSKSMGFQEDVGLTVKKLSAVGEAIKNLAEGSNVWYLALQDAVSIQQHILDLENQKTESAQKYFELTGKGLTGYVNARSYAQGRDVVQNNSNMKTAVNKYQNSPSNNYTENLVNLQVIGDMYNKVQSQFQDYRDSVVQGFKAGAISLADYIKKLNELRDVQSETKQQALSMNDSINSTFQQSLSGSLKSGMEGNQNASLDFANSIKSGIADTISSQMSTIMLTQSGLMDNVNGMIGQMIAAMTQGPASANAFNVVDFKKMMDSAINPIMPYITAISDSTKGMFAIMKDQVFNAPSGFKIENYLYKFQKSMSMDEYNKKFGSGGLTASTTPTNEAGSPFPATTPSTNISFPTTNVPVGNGIGQIINNAQKAIDPVINGASPLIKDSIRNPVKDLLGAISQSQAMYDKKSPLSEAGNSALHGGASSARDLLSQLSANNPNDKTLKDLVSKLGDGTHAKDMTESDIKKYLETTNLSSYDMKIGIDGVGQGIDGMTNATLTSSDNIVNAVNGITGALGALRPTATTQTPPPASYNNGGTPSSSTSNSGTITSPISAVGKVSSGGSSSSNNSGTGSISSPISAVGKVSTPVVPIPSTPATPVVPKPSTPAKTGQAAFLDSLKANGTAGQKAWANQYEYLNGLAKGTGGTAAWAVSEMAKAGMTRYHTGGIAGIMNFANGDSLKPNEVQAVLRKGEPVFSRGQLGSFMDGMFGGGNGGGTNGKIQVDVNINGNSSSVSDSTIADAIREGIQNAVGAMQRQTRLGNLRNKGVSYS